MYLPLFGVCFVLRAHVGKSVVCVCALFLACSAWQLKKLSEQLDLYAALYHFVKADNLLQMILHFLC